jgi:outer membrane protein TolC
MTRLWDEVVAEARLAETADRATVQTVGRGAFARPGLNLFDEGFGPFAVAGVRLNWSAWDWGQSDREARSLRIQSQVASSRRASIVEGIERETFDVLHEIDRLEAALEEDARIVELRASVEETARRRLDRGVILPTQYVDRRTELFQARLNRRRHEVELAQHRIRLLRILGHSLEGAQDPGLVRSLDATARSTSESERDDPTDR